MTKRFLPWVCDICTAACTFEAMEMCRHRPEGEECGYERDRPLANHPEKTGREPDHEGMFEFVVPEGAPCTTSTR